MSDAASSTPPETGTPAPRDERARELRRDWWLAGGALVAAAAIFGSAFLHGPSDRVNVSVTVVPLDATTLECRSAGAVAELHCGELNQAALADPRLLRPYVTVSGELVLLAGVFQQPDVAEWLAGARRKRHTDRVTLRCEALRRGDLPNLELRFSPTDAWQPQRQVPALSVERCRVRR